MTSEVLKLNALIIFSALFVMAVETIMIMILNVLSVEMKVQK